MSQVTRGGSITLEAFYYDVGWNGWYISDYDGDIIATKEEPQGWDVSGTPTTYVPSDNPAEPCDQNASTTASVTVKVAENGIDGTYNVSWPAYPDPATVRCTELHSVLYTASFEVVCMTVEVTVQKISSSPISGSNPVQYTHLFSAHAEVQGGTKPISYTWSFTVGTLYGYSNDGTTVLIQVTEQRS